MNNVPYKRVTVTDEHGVHTGYVDITEIAISPEDLAEKSLCRDGRHACFYCANTHNWGGVTCECECHTIHTHQFIPSLNPDYEICAFCGESRKKEVA